MNKDLPGVKQEYSEIICQALKGVKYKNEADNNKFRSAVSDLSLGYADEGRFISRVVDDEFLKICSRAFTCKPEQIDAIKRNASEHLQKSRYHTSEDYSDYIADQIVNGFLKYVDKDFYIILNDIEIEEADQEPSIVADQEPSIVTEPVDIEDYRYYIDTLEAKDYKSVLTDEPAEVYDTPLYDDQPVQATRKKPRIGVLIFAIICVLGCIGYFSDSLLPDSTENISGRSSVEDLKDKLTHIDDNISMLIPITEDLSYSHYLDEEKFTVSIGSDDYYNDESFMKTLSDKGDDTDTKGPEEIQIDGRKCYCMVRKSDVSYERSLYLPKESNKTEYITIDIRGTIIIDEDAESYVEDYYNKVVRETEYIDDSSTIIDRFYISAFGIQIPRDDLMLDTSNYYVYQEEGLESADISVAFDSEEGLEKAFSKLKEFNDGLYSDDPDVDYSNVDEGVTEIDGVECKWITYNRKREDSISGEYYLLVPNPNTEEVIQIELDFDGDITAQENNIDAITRNIHIIE